MFSFFHFFLLVGRRYGTWEDTVETSDHDVHTHFCRPKPNKQKKYEKKFFHHWENIFLTSEILSP